MTRITRAEEFDADTATPTLLVELEDGQHIAYSTSRDGHIAPVKTAHLDELVRRAEVRSTGQ